MEQESTSQAIQISTKDLESIASLISQYPQVTETAEKALALLSSKNPSKEQVVEILERLSRELKDPWRNFPSNSVTVYCPTTNIELYTYHSDGTVEKHNSFGKCKTCGIDYAKEGLWTPLEEYAVSTKDKWAVQYQGYNCLLCTKELVKNIKKKT